MTRQQAIYTITTFTGAIVGRQKLIDGICYTATDLLSEEIGDDDYEVYVLFTVSEQDDLRIPFLEFNQTPDC